VSLNIFRKTAYRHPQELVRKVQEAAEFAELVIGEASLARLHHAEKRLAHTKLLGDRSQTKSPFLAALPYRMAWSAKIEVHCVSSTGSKIHL